MCKKLKFVNTLKNYYFLIFATNAKKVTVSVLYHYTSDRFFLICICVMADTASLCACGPSLLENAIDDFFFTHKKVIEMLDAKISLPQKDDPIRKSQYGELSYNLRHPDENGYLLIESGKKLLNDHDALPSGCPSAHKFIEIGCNVMLLEYYEQNVRYNGDLYRYLQILCEKIEAIIVMLGSDVPSLPSDAKKIDKECYYAYKWMYCYLEVRNLYAKIEKLSNNIDHNAPSNNPYEIKCKSPGERTIAQDLYELYNMTTHIDVLVIKFLNHGDNDTIRVLRKLLENARLFSNYFRGSGLAVRYAMIRNMIIEPIN